MSEREKAIEHLQNALFEVRQARVVIPGLGLLQQLIKSKISEVQNNNELTYGVEIKDRDFFMSFMPDPPYESLFDLFDRGPKPTCKLDSGEIMEYDACSENEGVYDPKKFKYIGAGEIDTIKGHKQTPGWRHHFYLRIY